MTVFWDLLHSLRVPEMCLSCGIMGDAFSTGTVTQFYHMVALCMVPDLIWLNLMAWGTWPWPWNELPIILNHHSHHQHGVTSHPLLEFTGGK